MKVDEYISRNFRGNKLVDRDGLREDLFNEMRALLEMQMSRSKKPTLKTYYNNERVLKMKLDSIRSKGCIFDAKEFWDEFHKKVLNPYKWKVFKDECEKEKKMRDRRSKAYKSFNSYSSNTFNVFDDDLFSRYFESFLGDMIERMRHKAPVDAFETLNLDHSIATDKDIKSRYKKLSMEHHPDRGGKQEDFIKLTEAKNKCLEYRSTNPIIVKDEK